MFRIWFLKSSALNRKTGGSFAAAKPPKRKNPFAFHVIQLDPVRPCYSRGRERPDAIIGNLFPGPEYVFLRGTFFTNTFSKCFLRMRIYVCGRENKNEILGYRNTISPVRLGNSADSIYCIIYTYATYTGVCSHQSRRSDPEIIFPRISFHKFCSPKNLFHRWDISLTPSSWADGTRIFEKSCSWKSYS